MKNIYITWHNEWKQIGKKFNWYTATVFTLEFENEPYTGGVEMRLIILGLGFTFRYNYDFESSPTGKAVEKYEDGLTNEELETKIEDILKDD